MRDGWRIGGSGMASLPAPPPLEIARVTEKSEIPLDSR
jgi:hypothetical protein